MSNSNGKVVLGMLVGLSAGALLGILFAPEKGSVTRKKISKRGEDYADSVKQKFGDFVDSVKDNFENTKERFVNHKEEEAGINETE